MTSGECSFGNNDYKCYIFKADISAKLEGCVYAHNKEEAEYLIETRNEDEIIEISNVKIENIDEIIEVDDKYDN